MPDVHIRNDTPYTLNIALSQVAPLHFLNGVASGKTFETHTGSVWFTVEWRIDNLLPKADGKSHSSKEIARSNRYSAKKSATTIAIVSGAGLSLVALAGPMALSAAAAAGSATAASLLASNSVIAAASSAEAVAFSMYAASTLTASAVEAVCEEHDVSPETSEKIQKHIEVVSKAVAASSVVAGAAKATSRGPFIKKAVLSAGSSLLSGVSTGANKKGLSKGQHADAVANETGLAAAGRTERVYGVYIGFKPRNLVIKERHVAGGGAGTMELWDVDKDCRVA